MSPRSSGSHNPRFSKARSTRASFLGRGSVRTSPATSHAEDETQ
jgi:hypothetical protein